MHAAVTAMAPRGQGRAAQVGRTAALSCQLGMQRKQGQPACPQTAGIQKCRKCSASKLGRLEGELTAGPVNELCVHVCIGPQAQKGLG